MGLGLALALALALGCGGATPTSSPGPAPSPTLSPQIEPYVEISVDTTSISTGDTFTVAGMALNIGLPLYRLHLDSGLVAEATYEGQVNWFESHVGLPFELVSTSATLERVEFELRARSPGAFRISIGVYGEIHPGGAGSERWGDRVSKSVLITVS